MKCLLAAVLVSGCSQGHDPAPAPAASPQNQVSPLLLRYRDSAAKLAPLKFDGTAHTVLREGTKVLAALDESFTIEAAGSVHAVYVNSRDAGRELYADLGTVWVRPRTGKFHRRPPATEDEVTRTLDDTYATLAAQVALVADGMTVTDTGPAAAMGRTGRKLLLSRGGGRVRRLSGEAIVDDKTQTVLQARLEALLELEGGRTLELSSTHAISPLPTPVVLPADDDAVATPTRSTDTEDREELLRGLAPPVVKKR